MIGVVGATASGKTPLAIKIAQKYDGEIISADSMQIYKGMNIATAKPDKEEMCGIPHHIMDFLMTTETFSVSQYVEMAKSKIDEILSRENPDSMRGYGIICAFTRGEYTVLA